jgi:NitT/TauT family transport system ATP-binding protein
MSAPEAVVRVDGVTKTFPRGDVTALQDIDLTLAAEEFVSLIGPSGCGKSTLLRVIGDLIDPTQGTVTVNGKPARQARADHDYGIVFQDAVLFEWRTVRKNIALPLELLGWDRARRKARVEEMLELVELQNFGDHHPWQLSGGMQQRVAIARALAFEPALLLMDEPFGALDSQTRSLMQELLLDIWQVSHKTVLFITHDIDESILLGDRVYVMTARPGRTKEMVEIELPRPRTVEMLTSEAFMAIKRRIMHLIHEEAMQSVATERPTIRS